MSIKIKTTDTNKPNGTGLARIVKATHCSAKGMKAAYKEESAFRQETWLLVASLPLSIILAQSIAQWALLVGSVLLILVIELINSAIEALTDRVSTEHHLLSGRAKDMASAAVTLTLLISSLIWIAAAVEWFNTIT
ncbi:MULTISPECIES: diacylglycerol kinase [unclassified Pseudoalteromonas]|uniref:diacylglycerol kinase n=1 Tax=unclassified Pseudoalteromonas TaxID=194690 RepID=UPI000C7DC13D|nr:MULTISPECIES: diacylglycerol kinase [unclassified Pseudoalteromonas]AUJ71131.1 Diacylglycerol kinase [Pseudoalteromonas sp. NC201]MCO7199445.1 diacylglycerol kinase [Pseudoalteromonas sp. OANN1]